MTPLLRVIVPVIGDMDIHEALRLLGDGPADTPFSDATISLIADFSRELLNNEDARRFPELQALGFWLRKTSLIEFRDNFEENADPTRLTAPRGVVFHIPPANVDSLFIYCWALSALTGNRNIIRLSQRTNPGSALLTSLLALVLARHPDTPTARGTLVVTYDHDDAITGLLSAAADCRVIWGGDATVNHIRGIALPAAATELTFPDRYSFAAIAAAPYLACTDSDRSELARRFFNDTWWFDQNGCSSPRMTVWVGDPTVCAEAAEDFFFRVEETIRRYGFTFDTSIILRRFAFVYGALIDRPIERARRHGAALEVLSLSTLDNFDRTHCGAGLIFQHHCAELSDLAPFVRRIDQTLTHFGFRSEELRQFAQKVNGRGIDRLVPIGNALAFHRYWDGYDLPRAFTRIVHLVP